VPLTSGGSGIRTHGGFPLTAFQVRPWVSIEWPLVPLNWSSIGRQSGVSTPVNHNSRYFMAQIMAKKQQLLWVRRVDPDDPLGLVRIQASLNRGG